MATRSSIAIKFGNVIKSISCQYDGYLDYNGRILLDHYGPVKTNQLIALGDVSSLRNEIGEKHVPASIECRNNQWTTFYGRDYDEDDCSWKTFQSEQEWINEMKGSGCEYFYLFDNGVWYVTEGNGFAALHEAIEIYDAEEAE